MLDAAFAFLPSLHQAIGLACLMVAAFGMTAIGAALGGRDRLPEADLLIGWAVAALLFVVLGGWLGVSLTVLSVAAAVLALASMALVRLRGDSILDGGLLKCLAWMAPLLAASASMEPSQWDEFTQWLPNARYLILFDHFPGGETLPASDSVFPAYPPGLTVLYLLTARLGQGFFDGVAPWFNLLLLTCAARLAVRLFRDDEEVGWASAAWGVLAVTALGTTFVPKLALSGYADTATAVAVGFSAILGLRVISGRGGLLGFACAFALLPMTKQGNFALMGLLLLGLGFVALRQGLPLGRAVGRLALGLIPTGLAVLAWRMHVTAGVGELTVRMPGDWEWALLPDMLESMKNVIFSKGGYFGFGLALVLAALGDRLRNGPLTLFALCFIGYNLFLLVVYLAILAGYESANAASYWRYNTHMGVFESLVMAMAAGFLIRRFGAAERLVPLALVLGGLSAAIAPFAASKYIRFDRSPAKLAARAAINEIAAILPTEGKLVVADARGTGFYGNYAEYHLGFGRQVAGVISAFNRNETARIIEANPSALVWMRSQGPELNAALGVELDPDSAYLLAREDGAWRVVRSWPFPPGLDQAAEKD